jgi:SepF-like predicted cell division protein (DUF552 family)
MSFTDTLKRSLGFEETESGQKNPNNSSITDMLRDVGSNIVDSIRPEEPSREYYPKDIPVQNPNPSYEPMSRPTPIYDDVEVIIPEQSFYEIVLIRPKSIDDVNYVVDQVIEEKNPVIIDLSFLERESPANFKLAGEKIKQMRARYGAQALLLSRSEEKNLIIISPKKVKLINKK